MKSPQEQLEIVKQGSVTLTPEDALLKKLNTKKTLKIKLGADPTAPDLHLGHAVVLQKLRQFQDLGHQVIFIIGDFTAKVGDPSGASKTRPPLSDEQIKQNAETYFEQVFKILDKSKTTVEYNGRWLSPLNLADLIKLCSKTTLARIIEREDFKNRLAANTAVGFHELLYPLLQGYDSVAIQADVELGGTDQTFNLLFGRHLQEVHEQEGQVVLTMPILEGLDGVKKMSKSLGNYISLQEEANNAFGKLMSISDELMLRYAQLLLLWDEEKLAQTKHDLNTGSAHPMHLKKQIATEITAKFWNQAEAEQALASFEQTFQKQDYSQVPEVDVLNSLGSECWIVTLLKEVKAVSSTSEAKRLIEANSVQLDEQKITDFKAEVTLEAGQILKVGKKLILRLK